MFSLAYIHAWRSSEYSRTKQSSEFFVNQQDLRSKIQKHLQRSPPFHLLSIPSSSPTISLSRCLEFLHNSVSFFQYIGKKLRFTSLALWIASSSVETGAEGIDMNWRERIFSESPALELESQSNRHSQHWGTISIVLFEMCGYISELLVSRPVFSQVKTGLNLRIIWTLLRGQALWIIWISCNSKVFANSMCNTSQSKEWSSSTSLLGR